MTPKPFFILELGRWKLRAERGAEGIHLELSSHAVGVWSQFVPLDKMKALRDWLVEAL